MPCLDALLGDVDEEVIRWLRAAVRRQQIGALLSRQLPYARKKRFAVIRGAKVQRGGQQTSCLGGRNAYERRCSRGRRDGGGPSTCRGWVRLNCLHEAVHGSGRGALRQAPAKDCLALRAAAMNATAAAWMKDSSTEARHATNNKAPHVVTYVCWDQLRAVQPGNAQLVCLPTHVRVHVELKSPASTPCSDDMVL